MKPEKNLDHAINNEAELTRKAEVFADLWIKQVFEPRGLGGFEGVAAMAKARADLVRMFYPNYDGEPPNYGRAVPERKTRKAGK